MEFISSDIDQSYNYVIRNGFQLNEWFYNCTGIDGFALGVPRPWLGSYFLTVGVVLMFMYIPCLIVICKSDLMKSSCYKIMVWLGILDVCCIFVNSIATGFLGIKGATLCSYPIFIFSMGALGCGCWMGSCATCILLGINRCCDVNQNLKIRNIFLGWRIYPTILVPVVYTLYAIFFTKIASFNSNLMSWFFNPLLPNGRLVFFQSVLICSFNAVAAYIYVYMQYFTPAPITIIIGQIAWQWSHGSVCLIYITMNRTIRRGVLDLFLPKSFRNKHKIGTYQKKVHRLSFSVGGGPEGRTTAQGPTSSGTAVF
ncbi:hypothetical protein B9Z55_015221 [Caenorhabditis nigoni]|nr:hypothetical protein B9Z55_015221 [Caenorhabditis nigoni]